MLRFFFDEAYRRIMQSQRYIGNCFKDLYTSSGGSNKRPDLRSRESILAERIKEVDLQLKAVSEFNLHEEEKLRRISWFDYNFHILALKKRQEEIDSIQ